jgi:undecaprenyl diphosphate synthase
MDGNGRWARARGLPREAGHRAGVAVVRDTVRAAPGLGLGILTLYAFSSDNWCRPPREVGALLDLFTQYCLTALRECVEGSVRVSMIGRRDRLPFGLRRAVTALEDATVQGSRLWLRIALDYSARDQLLSAATRAAEVPALTRERFALLLGRAAGGSGAAPDVDLLIRTGGEQRLSDFLLWECAYAELFFHSASWPDFGPEALAEIVAEFHRRERRFGAIGAGETGRAVL